MTALVLILASIPSVLFFFFLRNNREDPEYKKTCAGVFWKGVICAAVIILADFALQIAWNATGLGEKSPLVNELFRCFILFAGVEETVKFLTAKKNGLKKYSGVSRLDVIAFMAIAAIGFGLNEDIVYAMQTNIGQIIVRGALMGHVAYGLLMGLLYGKGLVKDSKALKALALILPIFFHGLYDFSLVDWMPDAFAFVAVLSAFASTVFIIVMIFFIRKKRKDPSFAESIFKEDEQTGSTDDQEG